MNRSMNVKFENSYQIPSVFDFISINNYD